LKCEGDQPRKAAIKQGFWLGRTEVTVGQWKQFVAATGYVTDGEKKGESHGPVPGASSWRAVKDANWKDPKLSFKMQDNSAVRCISWDDAVAFCNWLNEREQKAGRLPQGFKVRLPVEPEWEYACRAGVQAKFWWGDSVEDGDKRLIWLAVKRGEVDSYGARGRNKFGLADMLGNVKEWCLDHFDPTGAHEELYIGDPSKRVVRGGSSYNSRTAGNIRCAGRGSAQAATSHCDYGFRICVGPDVLGSETTTAASVTPAVPQPPALDSRLSALDSFCREVAALPAEAQVQRVVAKLKELNPGFDPVGGVERSEIENGKVMGLWLTTGAIADLSPLRALTTLTSFSISTPRGSGTRWQQSRLSDLSPLRGMNLTKLWIDISQVSDLSPLAGQPLKTLFIISSPVTDLSPLRGMALEILRCEGSAVADLRPLAGMSSLRELNTHMTRVTDLSPLKGLQLRRFWCAKTKVRDLSVLRDMPLDKLWCDPDTAALSENVRFLKPIQTLKTINDLPAAEFWRRVEAGEVPQAK
jgi:formylglycine-generating enzyme required for sulfatase activity